MLGCSIRPWMVGITLKLRFLLDSNSQILNLRSARDTGTIAKAPGQAMGPKILQGPGGFECSASFRIHWRCLVAKLDARSKSAHELRVAASRFHGMVDSWTRKKCKLRKLR
jgi:hypothetical protein